MGYEHFDPDREGLREALCTLANGYFDDLHVTPPGTLGHRVAVSWATRRRPGPRRRLTEENGGCSRGSHIRCGPKATAQRDA